MFETYFLMMCSELLNKTMCGQQKNWTVFGNFVEPYLFWRFAIYALNTVYYNFATEIIILSLWQ